jgi:hypothetical protein
MRTDLERRENIEKIYERLPSSKARYLKFSAKYLITCKYRNIDP